MANGTILVLVLLFEGHGPGSCKSRTHWGFNHVDPNSTGSEAILTAGWLVKEPHTRVPSQKWECVAGTDRPY